MKLLPQILIALLLGPTLAWAQNSATVAPVPAAPRVVCPYIPGQLLTLCPGMVVENTFGDPVVLVLGTEERFPLAEVPIDNLNWRDIPQHHSLFAEGNPLNSHQPTRNIVRHGNPYYPYYSLRTYVSIAGTEELFIRSGVRLSSSDLRTLQTVADRYRGLTPQQAQLLGYQPAAGAPEGTCLYINNNLLDNRFDAAMPEALVYTPEGNLVGVQYLVVSPQPITIFGQTTRASLTSAGAQQLTVRLYDPQTGVRFE